MDAANGVETGADQPSKRTDNKDAAPAGPPTNNESNEQDQRPQSEECSSGDGGGESTTSPPQSVAVVDVQVNGGSDVRGGEEPIKDANFGPPGERQPFLSKAAATSPDQGETKPGRGGDTVIEGDLDAQDDGDELKEGGKGFTCSRAVVLVTVGVMGLVWLLGVVLGLTLGLRDTGDDGQGAGPRLAVGGVAADHPACAEVGRSMLARGGSAVDAAVATLICTGVRHPHSMGIGGGLFLMVYTKDTRSVDTYDGRERAPQAATFESYLNKTFLFGPSSVGVPGEMLTYWEAHQKHGRLPWKDLFLPAIKMAADGHPLSASARRGLDFLQTFFKVTLSDYPELCKLFCKENCQPKETGDEIKMPALAKTLQAIADQGPSYLYSSQSPGAKALVRDMQQMGVPMTLSDLEQYKVVKAPPVSVPLRDLTLHTLTAPSGGPVLGLMTKLLQDLNFTPDDLYNVTRQGAAWHRMVEAFKFSFADRFKLGDPAYVDVAELLEKMASPEYARMLLEAIDPSRTYDTDHYSNITTAPWREEGTSHISVIDPAGNAVAATSTVNYYFGSLLISPSTGIILNNEMADFSTPDGPDMYKLQSSFRNFIQPGKRPMSSMSPVIIVDETGNPFLVMGSSGGSRIMTVNAQVIARVLWMKQSLKEAINAKRVHHQLFPNELVWESGLSQDLVDELASYGHKMKKRHTYIAVVQAVSRDATTREITAFSDPRKQGEARLLYSDEL